MISPSEELEALQRLLAFADLGEDASADPPAHPDPPKPWWQLLPEETPYKDTGCELSPSCLACHLERCAEDQPRGRQRLRQRAAAAAVKSLLRQGYTQVQIARLLGVSDRTIRRYKNAYSKRRTHNDSANPLAPTHP